MERAVGVQRRVANDRRIELHQSLGELTGPVEVTLRPVPTVEEKPEDILGFLARLPPATRSKEDIDGQIRAGHDCFERPWGRD